MIPAEDPYRKTGPDPAMRLALELLHEYQAARFWGHRVEEEPGGLHHEVALRFPGHALEIHHYPREGLVMLWFRLDEGSYRRFTEPGELRALLDQGDFDGGEHEDRE